jgi:hypothetical protein
MLYPIVETQRSLLKPLAMWAAGAPVGSRLIDCGVPVPPSMLLHAWNARLQRTALSLPLRIVLLARQVSLVCANGRDQLRDGDLITDFAVNARFLSLNSLLDKDER